MKSAAARLRAAIGDAAPVYAPDCNTALTARIVERTGFLAGYVGGNSLGMLHYAIPDFGIISTAEMISHATPIVSSVQIPIIVDSDELGESPARVHRSVKAYEAAGVAAIHVEDEQTPKHSRWQGPLLSVVDMQARIAAAVDARSDPDFMIIARSNELENRASFGDGEGNIDEMIRRGIAYAEAGADMFLCHAAREEELTRIVREVPIPIADYNRPRSVAKQYGISLIIYTGFGTAAIARAHQRLVEILRDTGEIPREEFGFDAKVELTRQAEYSSVIRKWTESTGRRLSTKG